MALRRIRLALIVPLLLVVGGCTARPFADHPPSNAPTPDRTVSKDQLPWKLFAAVPQGTFTVGVRAMTCQRLKVTHHISGTILTISVVKGQIGDGCFTARVFERHLKVHVEGYNPCAMKLIDGATGKPPPSAKPHGAIPVYNCPYISPTPIATPS